MVSSAPSILERTERSPTWRRRRRKAEGGDFDDWPLITVVVARAIADGDYPVDEEPSAVPSYPSL